MSQTNLIQYSIKQCTGYWYWYWSPSDVFLLTSSFLSDLKVLVEWTPPPLHRYAARKQVFRFHLHRRLQHHPYRFLLCSHPTNWRIWMYHLVYLPYVANCTFIFTPAFGLQLKNEIHFISAKPQSQRLRPPEPRSISASPIVPRRPSSPLLISLPGSPEDLSDIVHHEYRTRVSSPKR